MLTNFPRDWKNGEFLCKGYKKATFLPWFWQARGRKGWYWKWVIIIYCAKIGGFAAKNQVASLTKMIKKRLKTPFKHAKRSKLNLPIKRRFARRVATCQNGILEAAWGCRKCKFSFCSQGKNVKVCKLWSAWQKCPYMILYIQIFRASSHPQNANGCPNFYWRFLVDIYCICSKSASKNVIADRFYTAERLQVPMQVGFAVWCGLRPNCIVIMLMQRDIRFALLPLGQ